MTTPIQAGAGEVIAHMVRGNDLELKEIPDKKHRTSSREHAWSRRGVRSSSVEAMAVLLSGSMSPFNPDLIPWASTGRLTPAYRVTQSLLPLGILPFEPHPPKAEIDGIGSDSPDAEKYLMHIVGTAIQVDQGKLLTTGDSIEAVRPHQADPFVLAHLVRGNGRVFIPYRIAQALRYVDPRTNAVNPTVDLALLIVPARSTEAVPYEVKPIHWGDSTQAGVGDPVMVAGYPLGTDLFLEYKSNRGFIQPTVYSGIIGAIVPAIQPTDTRLFRITVPGIGGISGGVVFNPKNGEVLGMVTTSMHSAALPQPVIYAIPSEILHPYVKGVTFQTA